MNFFKKLFILGAFTPLLHAAPIDNAQFLVDYQENVKYILKNYPQAEGKNLEAQIFDINNNSFMSFLNSSKGYRKAEGDLMAMMYYDSFKVNDRDTSFCFILYDSKSILVKNYVSYSLLNYADTTAYLALHEMGHCLYAHQLQIGGVQEKVSARENEQIADMFSIAYFSILGQSENAAKIIRQARKIDKKDIHYNPDQLERFYVLFNNLDNIAQYSDFKKIFKISFELFLQIKNNESF